MHSPTLEKILKKHKVVMPSETDEGHIVGDEKWYFVCDEQKFLAPTTLSEAKNWILAFFECFGRYPLERPMYENDDYIVEDNVSANLVADIEKNIDAIMDETEEFKIMCMSVDADYEGNTFHYLDGIVHIDEIYPEDIVEFFEYYGMDGDFEEDF
jgi:hypothetical protein